MSMAKVIRKTLTIIVSLAVLVAVLAYMSGFFHPKVEPHKLPVEVRRIPAGATTDTVHAVVEMEKTTVVGTLRAEQRTAISAKIMATVSEITVGAGDRVKKGAVLVRLDDRDFQARLQQARKAVEAARATAEQTAADLKRFQSLFEQKVISKQQLDQQQSRNKVAQAQLQRAMEAVKEAQVALSYTVIKAPTDGIVVDKQVDVGDTAAPGQPLLAIYDPSALRLEAPVREALASRIKVGDPLEVKIDALNLDLEGRIDEIVPQALAASRSILIKVAVPKKPKMVEGMYGRLYIPTRVRRRFCLALSAVEKVGQLRFVDVVTTGGVLERRAIKLGEHSEYGRVEVISGLKEGETVLLHGPPPPPLPPDYRLFGRAGR